MISEDVRGRGEVLSEHQEFRFNRALARWHEGDSETAIRILTELVAEAPEFGPARMMLGAYLADAGFPEDALLHLRQASELGPKSELASRALFHALYDLERREDAAAVLRKYLAVSDSSDLSDVLSEIERELLESNRDAL